MHGGDRLTSQRLASLPASLNIPPDLCARFTAEEFREVRDAASRRARIADLVAVQIAPRLAVLHAAVQPTDHPSVDEIAVLARLVLSPDGLGAASHVAALKDRGLSVDLLFAELLEPAAQLLGRLWDEDKIDFIDVTLGVARLQALLSVFNCTHELAPSGDRRSVLMMTVPGEQHSFGIAMVERFLGAGGWRVVSEREARPIRLAQIVEDQVFAVAGVALSNRANLDQAAAAVATIRRRSCNKSIGIMVGGPVFSADPALAAAVGADGTAATAPTAVVLAQKLLDKAIAAEAAGRGSRGGSNRRSGGSVARSAN